MDPKGLLRFDKSSEWRNTINYDFELERIRGVAVSGTIVIAKETLWPVRITTAID